MLPALAQSFQEVIPGLNDADAYAITWNFQAPAPESLEALQSEFDRLRPKGRSRCRKRGSDLGLFFLHAYQRLHPLIDPLVAADYNRRYTTDTTC